MFKGIVIVFLGDPLVHVYHQRFTTVPNLSLFLRNIYTNIFFFLVWIQLISVIFLLIHELVWYTEIYTTGAIAKP